MRRSGHEWTFLLAPLLLVACQGGPAGSLPGATPAETGPLPGELSMRWEEGTAEAVRRTVRARSGVRTAEPVFENVEHWILPGDTGPVLEALSREPHVRWSEPVRRRRIAGFTPEAAPDGTRQWYLAKARGLDVQAAWSLPLEQCRHGLKPGAGVVVAVVDTGVDISHPDLVARIARVPADLASRSASVLEHSTSKGAGNPWVIDEIGPESTFGGISYTGVDGNGHGTHCAGLVGASDDGQGIVGVAPGVTILPVKTMRYDGSGDDVPIARGLVDAADAGADVINFSVGGPEPSQILADALAHAYRKGVTVVIAAGNGFGDEVYYPAAYAGVISVGATSGASGNPWAIPGYSNRGQSLALVAPGGDGAQDRRTTADPTLEARGLLSTLPTRTVGLGGKPLSYGVESGTSMATPLVSGVAALVIAEAKARGESHDPVTVRTRLIATARPLGDRPFDPRWGYGFIRPALALSWTGPDGGHP